MREKIQNEWAKPHGSVSGKQDFKTGGCWFDPWLGQYSFQRLTLLRATEFIPPVHCFNKDYVGKQPVALKEYCAEYCLKELQESMDSSTAH